MKRLDHVVEETDQDLGIKVSRFSILGHSASHKLLTDF